VGSKLRELILFKDKREAPAESLSLLFVHCGLSARSGCGVMCRCAAEEFDHSAVEGGNIIGFAAGDKILIVHNLLVDPLRTCVAKIGFAGPS
jgi:hypothetical protein